ncbi:unnamed protein product [Owenia fusiformis]|nr:unnamed protein product [Owenia fusiformis]
MCLTSCFTTFVSLLFFTISRTFFIRSRHRYLDFATKPRLIALCLICWVIGLTLEAPNIFGWGHTFDQKSHSCMWDRTGNYKYTLFISIGCIGAPLVAMAVCHVLTFKHIRDAKLMVYNHSLMKTWKETVKSSRILLIFFAAFAICWIPYTLVIAIDPLDELPMEVHLWVTFLAHTHSTLHPIILIFTNKRMRKFFNFKNRVSPVEMDVKKHVFQTSSSLKGNGDDVKQSIGEANSYTAQSTCTI